MQEQRPAGQHLRDPAGDLEVVAANLHRFARLAEARARHARAAQLLRDCIFAQFLGS